MKKFIIALFIMTCSVGVFDVLFYSNSPQPLIVQEYPKTTIDPSLQPLVKELGINPYGLDIQYGTFAKDTQNGEYDGNRSIKVVKGDTKQYLAHEYLHYIWNNKALNKDELSNSLNEMYNSDIGMQYRMKGYVDSNILPNTPQFTSELHSIYCTESSDQYLNQIILNDCNKWINRNSLTFER
jgi:hypothetical protein